MLRVPLALGMIPLIWLIGFAAQRPDDSAPALPNRSSTPVTAEVRTSQVGLTLAPGEAAYLVINNLDDSATRMRLSAAGDVAVPEVAWRAVDVLRVRRPGSDIPVQAVSRRIITRPIKALPVQAPPKGRLFFLHVTAGPLSDPNGYVPVFADPVAEGHTVRVYLDRQTPADSFPRERAEQIVAVLERDIIPRADDVVGGFSDIDSDGFLSVLVTPWLDRLQGGRTSVNGFVRGSDFQPGLPRPLSNHADVIYLNSEMPPETHLPTLLGHEYLHLVAFSIRNFQSDPPRPLEEDWLSEAEAHLAENLFGGDGSNLAHRVEAFLAEPGGTPLVVRDYYHRGLWRDERCRGATYLFMRWLADVYGEDVLPQLLQGDSAGVRNLEAATGERFAALVQHWTLALLASARGETEVRAGYRYFQTDAGGANFGNDILSRLAIPSLGGGELDLSIAPTGSVIVRLDETVPRELQLRVASPGRLQLTLVPLKKAE